MNNLYVIAIGGSGERVMRSLILTLASGVQPQVNQIIPVFVDNDETSNAFTKCMNLIHFYSADPADEDTKGKLGAHTTYKSITNDSAQWPSFCHTRIGKPIVLNKAGDAIGNLATVIGALQEDNPIHNRIAEEKDLLFTEDDLTMPLSVGFVGNPNIGSVVLNSLSLADEGFKGICDSLSPADGVIVVGSLFGGTGAAGLPLIVNSINSLDNAHHPLLGAVAVLPYFTTSEKTGAIPTIIDTNKWNVEPDSFDTKTRAALMYYDDYMRQIDYMYYVGDGDAKDVYPHCVGGEKQENPAHLVELLSSMAIIDFASQGRNDSIVYKMPVWRVNDNNGQSIPCNFSSITNKELKKALAKFRMMRQIIFDSNLLETSISEGKDYVKNIGFGQPELLQLRDSKSALNSDNAWGFNNIISEWMNWMNELGQENRKRKFRIYNDSVPSTDENLTHNFYVDATGEVAKGIAKTEFKSTGFLKLGNRREVAMDAELGEQMLSAYRSLYPKGKAADATMIPVNQKIPRMFQIISVALDKLMDERCVDM